MVPTLKISGEYHELHERIKRLANSMDDKLVKKLLTKASKPYRSAAKAKAPVNPGPEPNRRYSTPKLTGKLKAPKGMGNVVATYAPGNLKRSIRKIALRQLVKAILIGPKKQKKNTKGNFAGNRVDGYYANMVEGGTKYADPQPFLEPAWLETQGTVLRNIETELSKHINQQVAV